MRKKNKTENTKVNGLKISAILEKWQEKECLSGSLP